MTRPGHAVEPPHALAVALTGTPGTGKSSVARLLRSRIRAVEVRDLARGAGAAHGVGRSVEVDLVRLRSWLRRHPPVSPIVYVGHLSHLLPVRDVVLLRCHPEELARRLRSAHRGTPADRLENATAEATDVILLEAVRRHRRVWEVDTTGRSPTSVAREVRALVARRPEGRYGLVRWLEDPRVTEHLLRPPR